MVYGVKSFRQVECYQRSSSTGPISVETINYLSAYGVKCIDGTVTESHAARVRWGSKARSSKASSIFATGGGRASADRTLFWLRVSSG